MQLAGNPAKLGLGRLLVPSHNSNYRAQSCGSRQSSIQGNENSTARDVACDAHAQHPPQVGLVAGAPDKDACGVGFVGELSKVASRKCVTDALEMLDRMTHRGACGCEENTGKHPLRDCRHRPSPDAQSSVDHCGADEPPMKLALIPCRWHRCRSHIVNVCASPSRWREHIYRHCNVCALAQQAPHSAAKLYNTRHSF